MTAPVEVIEVRPITGAAKLRAEASVRIGAVTLHGFTVAIGSDGQPFVGLPSRRYSKRGGAVAYERLVDLDRPLHDAVTEAVLTAWRTTGHDR